MAALTITIHDDSSSESNVDIDSTYIVYHSRFFQSKKEFLMATGQLLLAVSTL